MEQFWTVEQTKHDLMNNMVQLERRILYTARRNSPLWQVYLPEPCLMHVPHQYTATSEHLQHRLPWTHSNLQFVATTKEGKLDLSTILELTQRKIIKLLVTDKDGASQASFIRRKLKITQCTEQETVKILRSMIAQDGTLVIYSANPRSKESNNLNDPLFELIRNVRKFFGQNDAIVARIIQSLECGEGAVYLGSSDFDLIVVLEVLIYFKSKYHQMLDTIKQAQRHVKKPATMSNLSVDTESDQLTALKQELETIIDRMYNFHYFTTSRKLI